MAGVSSGFISMMALGDTILLHMGWVIIAKPHLGKVLAIRPCDS